MPSPAVALAQALIRCRSVTPNDGGALPLLADRLRKQGFATELLTFTAPGMPDVLNLYARLGTAQPCLAFAGHIDVVPPGETAAWRHDPFAGEIEDGLLFGRGACDMKSGVAAFVAAALDHAAAAGVGPGSIALLLTGDEEGPAVNGTAKLLDWALARGERFAACVVGEPTCPEQFGDMIKHGRRGSLTGTLTVHGRQGHVAYPHRADNPLPPLVRLLGALLAKPFDEGTPHFDPSNLELVSVDTGNPADNVIPAEARARFNIRFNDRWTATSLRAEIEARVDEAAGAARATLAFDPCNALPFVTAPGPFTALVVDAVMAVTGRRPVLSTTGGTSDARFLAPHCPVVEFGVVGQSMHAVDEHVAVADIDRLVAVYRQVIAGVLGRPEDAAGALADPSAPSRRSGPDP